MKTMRSLLIIFEKMGYYTEEQVHNHDILFACSIYTDTNETRVQPKLDSIVCQYVTEKLKVRMPIT